MVSDVLMIGFMPLWLFIIFTFHEFGHYFFARIFHVKVDALSIGFGKIVAEEVLRNGVSFRLRRFPLSGRVTLNEDSFEELSFFKKLIILFAGPFFNFILAFLVMVPVFVLIGLPSQPPVISAIKVNQVADNAGLQYGDRIVSMDGVPIQRYESVSKQVIKLPASEHVFEIERDGQFQDITITPYAYSFIDVKGIARERGVLGVIVDHVPIHLKSIVSVDGVKARDKDHARELVIDSFDKDIRLVLETGDNKDTHYRTKIYSKNNQHLFDENHKRYKKFYLGKVQNNVYKSVSLYEGVLLSLKTMTEMLSNVISIPSQIFPIDGTKLKPKTIVYDDDIVARNFLFRVAYFIGVISIFIGFLNLVPLPHFDGGQILLLVAQKFSKKTLSRKVKARIIAVALISLYLAMMLANVNKISLYVEAKIENVQEWFEDL